MGEEHVVDIELKDVLRTIRKRFYIVIFITIPVLLLSIYYSNSRIKPLYKVETSVIIGNSIDKEGTKFRIDDVRTYEEFMATYSAIAKTTVVSEKTIKILKLNVSPELLKNSIIVIPQQGTQFMDLQLNWTNSQDAVNILNAFTKAFIEEAKSIYPTCNIKIMEKVKQPQLVISSSKKLYIVLGLFGGIMISLLIIFALEFLDNTLKSKEDIEKYLKLLVIGEIPKERKKIHNIGLEFLSKLNYSVMEAYRTLRTNIYFTSIYKDVRSIVVTSGKPDEGKTATASMLSVLMALNGKKTLLIDCNLRKSNIHEVFNFSNEIGLTNILLGEVNWMDAVHKSEIENLFILTAGVKPPNSSELLSSIKMKEFMEVLKGEFDYIILDTPPVGIVTDAQVLSQFVDGYLLVVSSGEAVRKDTIKAKELIQYANGRILGVLLNKIKDSTGDNYGSNYERVEKNVFSRFIKKIKCKINK
ncbi:hypothetical protein CPJCM30710_14260 [Clostridium polyendosporum]|uniref:non-specific protein-tyrosine kinase n=1 Tax=Clostridium polyendosporum TaxID=69208 RepID=A0A919RYB0_9CLOT|nr:polysaccharide biosynthesis tyrosine autokinase [Clostridium polyendosporum]GIM28760.1 hypothetical protein CPJCM30710_14260 [Clostridium polyendosporum]